MKTNRIVTTTIALSLTLGGAVPAAQADKLGDMISPVSNPVNFEDPRILSDIRPIFAHHEIDDKFVTAGGDVNIFAVQARLALNDRLAIIATKDGYVDLNPDSVLPKKEGIANIAAGLKYAFYLDPEAGQIATAGVRYEFPWGDKDVLQGQGDGVANVFLSGASNYGNWNVMGYSGFRFAVDNADSSFFDASAHVDYKVGSFYPLAELNYFYVMDGGKRLPIEDEGQDFFNLGSSDAGGESMLTLALGARYKFTDKISIGAAYEIPVFHGAGTRITDSRITADLVFNF